MYHVRNISHGKHYRVLGVTFEKRLEGHGLAVTCFSLTIQKEIRASVLGLPVRVQREGEGSISKGKSKRNRSCRTRHLSSAVCDLAPDKEHTMRRFVLDVADCHTVWGTTLI